ncbi:MAG TPA: hypothetical protein VEL73_07695 [Mycobacteriales bacterium]|nr:hypothetical protein [Mycobacteriales bacterium]
MTGRITSPLAAAVGLASVATDELRRLPSRLSDLPTVAARRAHQVRLAARDRYDELALRGHDVLATGGREAAARTGAAPDRAAAAVDDAAALTAAAAGRVADRTGGRVDGAADSVARAAEGVAGVAGRAADRIDRLDPTADELAARAADAEIERGLAGSGRDGAGPDQPVPFGRTEPVVVPEAVRAEVAGLTPGDRLAHDELPLPDFDHLTVPQLRGRLRTLELVELVQLRDYERAHAERLPVLTLLENRIAKLAEAATD